ncbi:MAG: class I SAM-dependent methyltransferase [Clostridia bacterium]|nr:class I SAM-dependent methyltransferase [Clostridia bacterium]
MSYIDRSFNDKFAESWYNMGGDFAYMFSKKLIAYLKKNNIQPKNVLDVYCGAGNLLAELQKVGIKCTGTEGSEAFIRFNKQNHKDMEFILTDGLEKFNTKEKFDLITCTYDLVNYMETYEEWVTMFKNAYKQLNNGGLFVFDFNTVKRLADWNTVVYDQSRDLDYVQTVTSNVHGKTVINYIYYVKDGDKYEKTSALYTETSFEIERVLEALKKAGFKDVKLCDFELNELSNPASRNKIHVIAKK